jgi:hypothetical protein
VGGSRRVKGWTDNGEPGEDAEGDQLARPVKVGVRGEPDVEQRRLHQGPEHQGEESNVRSKS